jgi:hypothetical protein
LLPAIGIEAVQADLQNVRVLPVLFGLLLMTGDGAAQLLMGRMMLKFPGIF